MRNDIYDDYYKIRRACLTAISRLPYRAVAYTVYVVDTITGVTEYSFSTYSFEAAVRCWFDYKSTFASASYSAFAYDIARAYCVVICVDTTAGHIDIMRKEMICYNV